MGAFWGSFTWPTMDPCSNCAKEGSVQMTLNNNAGRQLLIVEPLLLPVSCPDGLAVAELDLDHLLAGRDPGGDFLRIGVIHDSPVRVGVLAIQAEGNPTRFRGLGRIFVNRHIRDMLRRKAGDVESVNVTINTIDEPDLLLIRPKIDAVTHGAVRFSRRRVRKLIQA